MEVCNEWYNQTTVRCGKIVREMMRRAFRRATPLAALAAVLVISVLATFELRVSRFPVVSSGAARFLPVIHRVSVEL